MEFVKRDKAVESVINGEEAYMVVPMTMQTSLEELALAKAFCVKAVPKVVEKKQDKKPIDHGKIIACHKAGWSVAKIADEMRCSEQTVRNHIDKEKAKA